MDSNKLGSCITSCNYGAHLIKTRDFPQAIRTLTEAMRIAKKFCVANPNSSRNPTSTENARDLKRPNSIPMFDIDVLMVSTLSNTDRGDSRPYVYRQPIQVPQLLGTCNQANFLVCVAATFNLALAYHLYAVDKLTPMSNPMLQHAAKLYELALSLQKTRAKSTKSVFLLASTNNLGQVYQALELHDKAQQHFHKVRSIILFMSTHRKADTKLYENFLRNAVHKGCCIAAGAA